jgi:RNA polymerase sigma-70 factor (ECF subfamily)
MVPWSEVVKQHGPLVWQTVYRLVRREADAADCFQNTFLAALELSRRQTIRHWPALLKHVATVQALNRLGQRAREERRLRPLGDEPGTSREVPPEQAAGTAELSERLALALAELEPRQAEVFALACLEGWSYQEIAAELNLTVNHVGVLLNRARAALRDRLRAFDPHRQREAAAGEQP